MALTKWYKAGTAGETADGRKIEEQWLIDIAENYDKRERVASIFLDHYRFYGNYGDVEKVRLAKDFKGRTCIEVQCDVTPNMLQLNSDKQYLYPSLGIIPNYSDTGKAYLGHLGQVQDPASVSVEAIKFSHKDGQPPDELLTFASADKITLELEPELPPDEHAMPAWFKNLFKKQDSDMDKQQAEEFKTSLASIQSQMEDFKKLLPGNSSADDDDNKDIDLATELKDLKTQFASFKEQHKPGEIIAGVDTAKFDALQSAVTELSSKLDDALKESGGTETPQHRGGGDDNFSIV